MLFWYILGLILWLTSASLDVWLAYSKAQEGRKALYVFYLISLGCSLFLSVLYGWRIVQWLAE